MILGCSFQIPEFKFKFDRYARVFQVRSHAQKHYLKAQKLGLGAALPPPKPRRRAVLAAHSPSRVHPDDNNAMAGTAAAQMWWPTAAASPPSMSRMDFAASSAAPQGAG